MAIRPLRRFKRAATAFQRYKRSRGFGIHSPFAFHFVLRVLREKSPYYCYDGIAAKRRDIVSGLRNSGRHHHVMSLKCACMLVRLSAWFEPRSILVLGEDHGLGVMALTSTSSKVNVTVAKTKDEMAAAIDRHDPQGGIYALLVNDIPQDPAIVSSVARATGSAIAAGGVIVFTAIDRSSLSHGIWDNTVAAMQRGMTFSNGKIGIIVADTKLPRQDFSLWI